MYSLLVIILSLCCVAMFFLLFGYCNIDSITYATVLKSYDGKG